MKNLRQLVPFLGMIALIALFLMLPETPSRGCTTCSSNHPYIPLLGAAYFSFLIAISLLFPSFPGPYLARAGLTWALLLALVLTYLHWPNWCFLCLVGHGCHILIWVIWVMVLPGKKEPSISRRERLCVLFLVPISVVALFTSLNLTFMAYGFKTRRSSSEARLQSGDKVPVFTFKTLKGDTLSNTDAASGNGVILNFVSLECPYCEEQLQILNTVVDPLTRASYRVVNISFAVTPEWINSYSPVMEWAQDREGHIHQLFKVTGYPTLFVIGGDGKIIQVIPGVPSHFKDSLNPLIH